MKQFLVLLTAILCSCTAFSQETEEDTFVKTGDKVPAFSFEIEKGKKVNISDYKGKLVQTPVKLTTSGRFKLTTLGRSKLTMLGRAKLTT